MPCAMSSISRSRWMIAASFLWSCFWWCEDCRADCEKDLSVSDSSSVMSLL